MKRLAYEERSNLSRELERAWGTVRVDRKIPNRSDFDVLEIPEVLPELIVVNVGTEADKTMQIIFAGSDFRQLVGTEITGMDAADIFLTTGREELWDSLRQVFDTPCGLVQRNIASYSSKNSHVLEVTAFPLIGSYDQQDLIVVTVQKIKSDLFDGSDEVVELQKSDKWSWIDVGFGTPPY